MPIGNLTSQIFANVYLNELDWFVKHELKVKYYLRYGDDFILLHRNLEALTEFRMSVMRFLTDGLRLTLNPKHDKILKPGHGLKFLGVVIWPNSRKLNKRSVRRIQNRLCHRNISSYYGLVRKHGNKKSVSGFVWQTLQCELFDAS